MKVFDVLDLTAPDVVLGQHSVWLPELAIKVPFQYRGRITKLSRNEIGYPLNPTLQHELSILQHLASLQMAPPLGDLIFFKEVISTYRGAWRSDPMGAYGFEMEDASKLPPGKFSVERMREEPIDGSDGAWGDVEKPGNVVNGYLVDVRRTAWDTLKWRGELKEIELYEEDPNALEAQAAACSFPKGERGEPYQDFMIGGEQRRGSRRIAERLALLDFQPLPGESVVDIGCQLGGVLQHSWIQQEEPGEHIGIEIDPDYVACAKNLARSCGMGLNFRQLDVTQHLQDAIAWVRGLCSEGPDHFFLLSMEKHIGEEVLWALVDGLQAKHTYIETNAMKADQFRLRSEVERRGGRYVGDSDDRNLRRLYTI